MIYLDNAATTPLDSDVLEKMTPYLTQAWGNPSSQHAFGRKAANAVIAARDDIAKVMGVDADCVYFTGSGTEADNTAIKGVCLANADKGRHIVISAIEHPALIQSAKDLVKQGFEVTLVYPDSRGVVAPQSVEKALRPDTVFVAVMAANNETGVIQSIDKIYEVCKSRGVFFFCDCVQTAGVLPFARFPADGLSLSAHKFYGGKGFGALYIKKGVRFSRLISGGNQERGLRGGTTFVAGAVGCAYALKKAAANAEENNRKVLSIRKRFTDRVLSEIEGTYLNGDEEQRLPANANISFEGCDGEKLLFLLDMAGIAVSTGSACSSGAVEPSHVLTAMRLGEERTKTAVRFTFGKYNTEEEADITVEELKKAVNRIRS